MRFAAEARLQVVTITFFIDYRVLSMKNEKIKLHPTSAFLEVDTQEEKISIFLGNDDKKFLIFKGSKDQIMKKSQELKQLIEISQSLKIVLEVKHSVNVKLAVMKNIIWLTLGSESHGFLIKNFVNALLNVDKIF